MNQSRSEPVKSSKSEKLLSAQILPLGSKYYGTKIEIDTPHGKTWVEVWHMGDYKPSKRELALLEPGEEFEGCDSHYESADGYRLAKIICDAINAAGATDAKA
jgi:hypothetical protein